ncbi:non-ribosomal peptide synthetase [Anabaena sp. FACHB-709]|nr:non-ribosomal peptide synthetase [Anabaena cylindrica FACHB-318]MBD2261925.1 non-ribosomal peptide synthetase [Anabaena sp. FACHB-709]MBD2271510.1 non-ribosomal peptide synthetase [Nostoc sp. PCC 7120 = FACHB-418]MBD2282220.1 non-ribosomal peptide synthetase [Anabaena cylindrica FACHB-170]MBD2351233.1 non-ribosomal peptide synthetase [Trichormus variabilis FACHB-171]HBW33510.1 non-ribosomal peptide synthetase [Nostoc sp. UBA8866]
MQAGMLFHTLYAPNSGVYFEQRSCLIRGNLNLPAFRQAWQRVVERHSVLRTAFHYSELEKPLQVVYDYVELPWQELDWCGVEATVQKAKLTEFLECDCNSGFNLQQPPLMRCAVIRLEANKYQFIWSHHHLLMDGWCNGILLTEVFTLYKAFCQSEDVTLPSPIPYGNYILWLQQQNPEQAESFWRKQLQDFTAPTVLGNKINNQSSIFSQQSKVNSQQTEQLQNFVRQHRLTLNILVQGAWALLLSRYSGENNVLFGTTVSGRPPELPQVESIVGLFINTLPVRVDVNGEMQIIPWLQQLQAQQVEREQYSYSSLVDIQSWSSVPRGTSLFESLLVFENYPVSIESVIKTFDQTLQIEDTQGFEKTNYPLTLTVIPGEELLFKVSYDVSYFDAATISRLLGHLETLLMSMVNEPEQRLSQLSMLTPQEKQLILKDWNQTTQAYPNQCIHQLFEAQVERTPDAIALVFGEECLTYRELNNKANQLAHYLQQLGVKPEILVGICLERSLEMTVCLLGIIKAGGAYVPIDPEYPQERIAYMLEDSQVKVFLTQEQLLAQIPQNQTHKICIDTEWDKISRQPNTNPDSGVKLDNLAYVIYTSGSTGKPKGVMNTHQGICNRLLWMQETYQINSTDSILQKTPFSFDVSVWEFFWTLLTGARLVIAKPGGHRDSAYLINLIIQEQITILHFVPSMLRIFLESGNVEKCTSLKRVICSGEALSLDLQNQFLERFDCELYNLYGPTEAAIDVTFWQCRKHTNLKTVPIGRPIANTHIYILDQHLQPVPIGVPGELYIGGAGVARGYLNRPELTAERFISYSDLGSIGYLTPMPHAPCPIPHALYKTGDRARYLRDGTIEYLGRLDNQVKIRGFRIELGEIETVLSQHSEVQAAIVVVTEDTTGDKRLVAYIVSENPEITDLRQYLAKNLPDYMIPSQFITLDALPLTPNGKVDRRALPKPQFKTSSHTIAPRTPTEELLLNIWQNILNLNSVGITDNFFALGGHSLLVIRLVSQIQQVFGVDISLRQIFENPTIAELATLINSSKLSLYSSIPERESTDKILLSFAQQRLWMLAQIEPENPSYNVAAALQLTGDVNVDVLTQSLQEIIHRHEILRTSFVNVDGQGIAVIATEINSHIPVVDLSFLPPSQQQKLVQELAQEESQQPFNLEISPLLRAKFLYLNTQEYILLLTMHHIITDGWSINVFAQEMATIYQAFSQGQSSPLQPLKIQYADFAVWQRSQSDKFNYQVEYWRQQLESAPELLDLPTDYPRPAIQTFRGQRHSFTISEELTEKIKQLGQETHTTLFMVMFSAFSILLHRYSQQEKIVIGSPVANRHYPGTEGLIGFFVNTFALLISLEDNPTVAELLPRVREMVLSAYSHQDVPFEQVVEELKLVRSLSHSPLFQVMLAVENAPTQPIEIPGLRWSPLEIDGGTAKFDITLMIAETDAGLQGKWEYNCDLFTETTIHRFTEHLQNILLGMTSEPSQKISDLPLMSGGELQQIINFGTSPTNLIIHCIQELFEQQVAKFGDEIAVICQHQKLTYSELNTKANQLAYHLKSLGVQPEIAVGICVHRSLDFIIGILAILKAGGFYVPLDPTYPQERLEFLIEDAQIQVILTQQQHIPQLPDLPIFCFDTDTANLTQHPTTNPVNHTTPENLAYVMYTSGSTGVPKGVCIPHRGVVRLVKDCNYINLSADESILQAAPISFDASTFEIWGALLNGSRLVILSNQQPTLAEIGQAITQHQITTLWLTAGLFHLMVDEHLESLKSVKQLIAGGDVLSAVHINKLLQTYPECRVINGYGPTENTTFTCCYSVTDICESNTVPIGRPINNTQVYILDNHLNPLPVGVPGELYIAGDGLARGYLNQPTLTAEKFINWGLGTGDWGLGTTTLSTLYKTGDRARYLADGNIEYLGRLDNQVKIRGFRIELGEIEAVLNQHPAVKECVVIAREKQLIAYFIALDNTPDNLREFLQQRLPDYLIPHFFVALETLPLTVNGKVDRQKLPAPEITSFPDGTVARSDIEAKLLEIWSSVLNLSQVSIYDNFFALGGDSILAIQLISKANQVGLQLTPKQLFQYQTIAELAGVFTVDKSSLLPQGMVTGAVQLTPIQCWFFEQELVNQHHFNQVVFLESGEKLQQEVLVAVINKLLLHHDMLRCQFGEKNFITQRRRGAEREIGEVVELGGDVPLVFCDLSGLSGSEQDRVIQEVAGEVQAGLNIGYAPLLRVVHFDLGEVSRLLIVIHHLVVDGVSWRILLADFQTAYQQALAKQTISLPAKTTSFLTWAEKLYDYARSECLQDELEYWLSNKYQQVKRLPIDYPDGGNQVVDVETVTIKLSVEDTQALLTEVSPVYNTQINDVLLTALTATISTWIDNPLVLLDLEGYGRNFPGEDIDISRTVGWFTTIYPCLLSKESDDWGELLKGIKEQLRAVPNQGFGYGILRYLDDSEASQRLRDLPQAEISFNYLGQLDLGLEHGKLKWLPLPGITTQDKQQTRRYAIEIVGFVREGKLQFDWIYSQQQYQQETISQLANNFQQGLQAIINHCRLPNVGGYTPSDFELANLNQETLDLVMGMISFAPEGLQ